MLTSFEPNFFFCGRRIIMTEAYTSLPNTLLFYGNATTNGSQIPFNFELISYTNISSKAPDYVKNINNWLNGMPKGKNARANWVVCFIFLLLVFTHNK